jgi:hypothetical protein
MPDENPQNHTDERLYCKTHHHMCEFIYGRFAHPDVRQQHLDVDFITEHFPEAMVICKHHDLVKLVTLEQDYSDELVMQLYSTVHFHEDDADLDE